MTSSANSSANSHAKATPACRYQIRQKMFSLGDNFKIKDEMGQDVFTVRSEIFTMGNKLVLEDMAGK